MEIYFYFSPDTKSTTEIKKMTKNLLELHQEKLKHYGCYVASPTTNYATPSGFSFINFSFLNAVSIITTNLGL